MSKKISTARKGFDCFGCDAKNLKAVRFVCLICENYELCEQCHDRKQCAGLHRPYHPMQPVPPIDQLLSMGQLITHIDHLHCPGCGEEGFNKSSLEEHYKKYHRANVEPVRCPICCIVFGKNASLCSLLNHVDEEHELHYEAECDTCEASCEMWYECLECSDFCLCGNCYAEKPIEGNHKPYHPMQFAPSKNELDQLLLNNAGGFNALDIFCCPYCADKDFNLQKLMDHCHRYHRNHGSMSVLCPVCLVLRMPSLTVEGTLLEHLKECHTTSGGHPDRSRDSDTGYCSICMEQSTADDRTLRCGHEFHDSCITTWLRHNTTCPVCRTCEILTVDPLNTIGT